MLKKIFIKYKKSIKLIIHCAAQPSHDWAKDRPFIDFQINAQGTLNLLELTKKYCKQSPFIFMSTNKVYGDNPNFLPLEEKNPWEINPNHKFKDGIDGNTSINSCTHSFFGASKSYADLIIKSLKKHRSQNSMFSSWMYYWPNHSGASFMDIHLAKSSLKNKTYNLIGYKGKQVRDNIHSEFSEMFLEFYKRPGSGKIYNTGGGRFSKRLIEALNIVEKLQN